MFGLQRRWVCAVALLTTTVLIPQAVVAQAQVPRVKYDDPIAGFSITIPADWQPWAMEKGLVELAIDAATGARLTVYPAMYFTFTQQPPEQAAKEIAGVIAALGNGATPIVRPTGRGDEWEVHMFSNGTRGPLVEQWVCRTENGRHYVIGAMARPSYAKQAAPDINEAIASCRLIPQPILTRFVEPTEKAYRITLPEGWKWDGQILLTQNVPGYFVWKAVSPDGLTGCFTAPPLVYNIAIPFTSATDLAQSVVLRLLRTEMADAQLERVVPLDRASAYYTETFRVAAGPGGRVDVAEADYVGTKNGVPIRVRTRIAAMGIASAVLRGSGNWWVSFQGAWAPVAEFDKLYPYGRGVLSSLVTSQEWVQKQAKAVQEVLKVRRDAMEKQMAKWSRQFFGSGPRKDPVTGNTYDDVPYTGGSLYVDDATGEAYFVPDDEEPDPSWRKVE